MNTLRLTLALSSVLIASTLAQTPSDTNAANANRTLLGGSARDGFTLRGTEVVVTRDGVTTKVEREMVLPSGLKVQANGNVTLRDGSTTALRPNQLLTLQGAFQDVLLTPQGVAPLSSVDPGPAPKPDAARPVRDGVFIKGAEVFITRNGITEKVTSDVRLSNGATVKSSGAVELGNGNTITLLPTQMLDLNGVIHDVPSRTVPIKPAQK